jgi:ABC-type bacteriocin/lantibiotic exporter with double-glycine peptidase domain
MNETGAGGNWKRIDEKFDASIVKQTSGLSCVSAVGEMLLESRGIVLSQAQILDIIGEPATSGRLAETLNKFDVSEDGKQWHGVFVDPSNLEAVLQAGILAVILREVFEMGHAVLVEGVTPDGLIKIKDPFDQTAYLMTVKDFLEHWDGEVIFYGRIK